MQKIYIFVGDVCMIIHALPNGSFYETLKWFWWIFMEVLLWMTLAIGTLLKSNLRLVSFIWDV